MKTSKPQIICDTNIWFGLADGTIPIEKIKDLELVLISNTLVELASSHLTSTEPLLLQKACKMALQNSKKFIPFDSFDNIIQIFKPDHLPNTKNIFDLYEKIRQFTAIKNKNVLLSGSNEKLQMASELKKPIQNLCNEINNNILPNIKLNTKNLKKHKKSSRLEGILDLTNEMIKLNTGGTISIPNGTNLSKLNQFFKTFEVYFRELENTNMKMEVNDWFDLFNLTFIQDNNLYWTLDKKWKELIKKAGFKERLFKLA